MKYLSGRHKYPSEHGYDHLRTVFNTPLNVYKYPSGRSYNHLGTVLILSKAEAPMSKQVD